MNNPYVRFFIISMILLLIGFGLGYIVKPSGVQPAHAAGTTFDQAFSQAAQAQDKSGQGDDQLHASRQNAITRAVAKISPAVVGINVIALQQVNPFGGFFNDPLFKQFFGDHTYNQEVKRTRLWIYHLTGRLHHYKRSRCRKGHRYHNHYLGGKQMKAKVVGSDSYTDILFIES